MTNPFYVASGTPATSSFGASQPMRSEFQAIQGGFEKFPDFTGSAPGTFLINNFTATGITTAPGMLIDPSGNIGIGTPPNPTTYLIDIRRDRASGSNLRLMNASLDPASGVGITLNNGSARNFHLLYLSQFAVNSGINRLDGAQIIATGDGGLTLATGVGTPAAGLYFATNSIERARFDNNGVFTVHTITQFDTNVSVTGSLSSNGPLTVGAVGMPGSVFFKRDSDGAIQTRISENSGNTGLYFETISGGWFSFFTSGAAFGSNLERMRIDSAGNVGIGVTAPIANLHVFGNGVANANHSTILAQNNIDPKISLYESQSGYQWSQRIGSTSPNNGEWVLRYESGGTDAIIVDRAGHVGIGMTPVNVLDITQNANNVASVRMTNPNAGTAAMATVAAYNNGGSGCTLNMLSTGYTTSGLFQPNTGLLYSNGAALVIATQNSPILFGNNSAERMRIDAAGSLCINKAAPNYDERLSVASIVDGGITALFTNQSANTGASLSILAALGGTPNNASARFLACGDGVTSRAILYSNGGLANYSANNVNLSDANVKDQITPYSKTELAALEQSFTDVIWGKFKYRDQTHDDWNHGPTAQGVERAFEKTAPELVDESELGAKTESGVKHKVIYETDLAHIAHALLAKVMKDVAMLKTYLPRA